MVRQRKINRKMKLQKQPRDTILSINRRLAGTLAKVASDTGSYAIVRLVDYPSVSDISSLFQFYRIRRFEMKFLLVSAPNNNATFPTLYIAPQRSALGGNPTSRDEVLQYQNVQTHQFGPSNLVKTISIAPSILLDSSGAVGGGTLKVSPYLSTTNTSIIHSGFVYWLSRYNSTADSTHTIDVEFSVWVDAKSTR